MSTERYILPKLLALVVFEIFFLKGHFAHGEVGDGSGGLNAISSRPEVADDVIFGRDLQTFLLAPFSDYSGFSL